MKVMGILTERLKTEGLFTDSEQEVVNYILEHPENVERGIDTSGIVLLDYGTFKVSSIAAKDCKAPIVSSIQGDQAAVTINGPVNGLRGFSVNHNSGDNEEYSFDKDTHRLLYEFLAFVKAIDEKDYALRDRMLEVSGIVSEIMTQARMSAGIVFPADNQ